MSNIKQLPIEALIGWRNYNETTVAYAKRSLDEVSARIGSFWDVDQTMQAHLVKAFVDTIREAECEVKKLNVELDKRGQALARGEFYG